MGQRNARIKVILPGLVRLALLCAATLVVDYFFGDRAALWFALVAFTAVLAFHYFFLALLGAWLEDPALDSLPEGSGTWSEVFARLYKARRTSELTESRLADNEQRFRRTISALPEGIVLVDAQLQIEWCNPVAERHLGISLRADQGLRLTNLVRDPAFVAYLTTGGTQNAITLRPLANPAVALSVQFIEFESARSIVLTRDITQSERVDAVRRDFVANVSHELRTPLTVVKGFLETLLDARPALDATRQHHLQLMLDQSNRMSHLVDDLLLLSRLEAQDTTLAEEDVDVVQLVRELGDEARTLSADRHSIALEAAPLWLRGSREELRSAFSNLVTNAVRYTPAGGRVVLRWRAAPDGAVFEVEDSGIGVAPEHIPRLTERFYRVDKSRSRETGGTGLGLAIVKHVLLRHDARLEVTSELGRGSVFAAHFPRARTLSAHSKDLRAA